MVSRGAWALMQRVDTLRLDILSRGLKLSKLLAVNRGLHPALGRHELTLHPRVVVVLDFGKEAPGPGSSRNARSGPVAV